MKGDAMRFDGKVALVTGGSSGIGRATSLAFARAGARVVVAARDEEKGRAAQAAIEAAGGEALFVAADVGRPADVARLFETAIGRFGRLDCAFNNAAGREGMLQSFLDLSEDDFDRNVAVNLKGVWLCMQHEIRQMLRQEPGGGAIVNTSSVNGLGGAPFAAAYSATKAGLIGLSKSAALEMAPRGIRVNVLAAGAFRTPMLEAAMQRLAGGDREKVPAIEDEYRKLVAQGRIGDPEEAADAVLWLCSDRASYVTGHTLIVDGGLTASMR
jgi:NAD(P)-dependent dehydrogenase (short-subunit alcohol dehydrogenase family)